jgi:predicted ester cyclase
MQQTIERTPSRTEVQSNREIAAQAIAQLVEPLPRDLTNLDLPRGLDPHVHCAGPQGHVCGVRGARPADRSLFSAFSDPELTVERTEEVGDRVISHVRFSGRHTQSYRGVAPTGRTMQARGVIVHDLNNGRIRDAWSVLRWR